MRVFEPEQSIAINTNDAEYLRGKSAARIGPQSAGGKVDPIDLQRLDLVGSSRRHAPCEIDEAGVAAR